MLKSKSYIEPALKLFIVLILTLFFIETIIMTIIHFYLTDLSPIKIIFLDSGLLVLALFPVLYIFVFRSYANEIKQRKKTEDKLIKLNENLEAEVEKRTENLEKANKLKDLFTDIIRHDLMNPAGLIQLSTNFLLIETPENEELKIIRRSSNKILEIIENAATFSKLENIKRLSKKELDLKKVIDDAITTSSSQLNSAGMKVENLVKSSSQIQANPLIEEVFANLLANASKYAADGKRVVIDLLDQKKHYKVMVKDFGPGILDKDKAGIFERFTRKAKSGVVGSGLGLTIAKRIVELHSGRIWVEDNPEGGSIFYVEIPKE